MHKINIDRTLARHRRTPQAFALLAASLVLAILVSLMPVSTWNDPGGEPAEAYDVPAAGAAFVIQTNGPNAAVGLGDWYTATSAGAGAGHHYATINIPCGWPSGQPIDIDLFSPEMNRVSGALNLTEEPAGNYDSTQFELYGPGAAVGPGFASPAPGTGIAGTEVTYLPGAAGVGESWVRFATLSPATCGNYVLRSSVLANDPGNPTGEGNDQNGWRLRVGLDDDADPTNPPPANADDFDGVPGTNDELTSGLVQISFQHDAGATACQTFFEYVDPAQASVTFNDFDFDNNGRVRYYAPSDVYDAAGLTGGTAGTISAASATWNVSNAISRGGDVINNPESGWWRIVTCISNHNQYIEEGQAGVPAYYAQPPTPNLVVTKSDGLTAANAGDALTYNIAIANTATGATAGAATNVVATDTLPSNTTFVGCTIVAPAAGTCIVSAGIVTMTLSGAIAAGGSVSVTLDVTVNAGASVAIQNDVSVAYEDSIGNPFAPVTASDVDIVPTVTPTPTASSTSTPTAPATATDTPSPTSTATGTPVATDTAVATDTPVATDTAVATDTPVATDTAVATDTPVATDTAIATDTPAVPSTPAATDTAVDAETSTATETPAAATSVDGSATPGATANPNGSAAGAVVPPQSSLEGSGPSASTLPNSGTGPSASSLRPIVLAVALMLAAAGAAALEVAAHRARSAR